MVKHTHGSDGKRKQPKALTSEEIQLKYYLEGPEAARTTQYIEPTRRTSRSPSLDSPVKVHNSRKKSLIAKASQREPRVGTFFRTGFHGAETNFHSAPDLEAATSNDEPPSEYFGLSDNKFSFRRPVSETDNLSEKEKNLSVFFEKKQRLYETIFLRYLNEDEEIRNGRDIYFDTDDEDEEDFYNRAEDYPEDDWQHLFVFFSRKYKHYILFMKTLLQVIVFMVMFAFVIMMYAAEEDIEELPEEDQDDYDD